MKAWLGWWLGSGGVLGLGALALAGVLWLVGCPAWWLYLLGGVAIGVFFGCLFWPRGER